MRSIKLNTYHPFTKSSLRFFLSSKISNESSFHNSLDNLDLYHQPLDHPYTSVSLFIARLLFCVLGLLVLYKVFKMVRREKGLVNEVTQFYCLVMITNYPTWLLFATLNDFLHPLKDIMGQWICTLMRVVFYINFNVTIFQSFVVALMRYCFIVHEQKIRKFGKQKTKNIFLFLTIFFPILLITWGFIENQEIDTFKLVNRCYGVDHKVFLAEHSTGKQLFCVFQKIDGQYGYILNIVRQITCTTKFLVTCVVGMNLSECLIYYKIFAHMTRFDAFYNIIQTLFMYYLSILLIHFRYIFSESMKK